MISLKELGMAFYPYVVDTCFFQQPPQGWIKEGRDRNLYIPNMAGRGSLS